jgi:hypothetical protein
MGDFVKYSDVNTSYAAQLGTIHLSAQNEVLHALNIDLGSPDSELDSKDQQKMKQFELITDEVLSMLKK